MFGLVVNIQVKPEHTGEFLAAMLANALGSRTEPGNIRYDVLQSADDPNHFVLYEIYESEQALAAHRETPHFQTWLATVEHMMVAPRTRTRIRPLFYGDAKI